MDLVIIIVIMSRIRVCGLLNGRMSILLWVNIGVTIILSGLFIIQW